MEPRYDEILAEAAHSAEKDHDPKRTQKHLRLAALEELLKEIGVTVDVRHIKGVPENPIVNLFGGMRRI